MRLSEYNVIDLERELRDAQAAPAVPPGTDPAYWDRVRERLGEQAVAEYLARAEQAATEPVPTLPATLYLEFARTGTREGYQIPLRRRRELLAHLMVGEILEGQGRFCDPLLDVAWAICEEASWAMPAHQRELTDPAHPVIDLGAAQTALYLAELAAVLGDTVEPALVKLIHHEIDRRCLTPYLARHDHWWLHNTQHRRVNNWTAVCTAGVVGAAIHTEPDPARLAEILARGLRSLQDYLATFDADGGSSEGPGYWSYGFGYYTLLADLVAHRTGGTVDLLDGERLRAIASYPLRTQLSPRRYVAFSDCDPDIGFVAAHLAYLSRRLDIPDLMRLAAEQDHGGRTGEPTWALRELTWRPDPAEAFVPTRHDWFSGMMWMLARAAPADPDGLVVAAKGGHNGEMHNQNDVGSFIVHLGGESVLADLGKGRYTKAYFGPGRYDHLVNSSLGHSVPAPDGYAQRAGQEYAARLLDHHPAQGSDQTDLLRLDLSGAYPVEARLESLIRTIALHHEPDGPWVELTDEVTYRAGQGEFTTCLITRGTAQIGESSVLIQGDHTSVGVIFDPATVTARIETIPDLDLDQGPTPINRILFTLTKPTPAGAIHLRILPAPPSPGGGRSNHAVAEDDDQ